MTTTMQAQVLLAKSTIVRFFLRNRLLAWGLAFACWPVPAVAAEPKTAAPVIEEASSPLALTPDMRAWVHRQVSVSAPPELRWRRLARALNTSPDLRFTEIRVGTATASEAFATRRANCVAFALLAVAMAREVGLDAYFVLMNEIEGYEGRSDLRIAYGHLAAGFGAPERRTVLDLGGLTRPSGNRARRVSDATALAIFYSNRGAERLLEGEAEAALPWLRRAVDLDSALPRAWVNLGVAERRAGHPQAAVDAYRRALEIDPGLAAAHENLRRVEHRFER